MCYVINMPVKSTSLLALLAACSVLVQSLEPTLTSPTVNYSRHRVIRITINTREQMEILLRTEEDLHKGLDIWKESNSGNVTWVDLLVAPDVYDDLTSRLHNSSITFDILFSDLQSIIDEQRAAEDVSRREMATNAAERRRRRRRRRQSTNAAANQTDETSWEEEVNEIVGKYVHHAEINRWLAMLRRRRANIVELIEIGTSYENRQIIVIKISSPSDAVKPAIWIDAGIHAREWIAPATAIYIIRALVLGYGVDPEVTRLVTDYDWYILPSVNPDGYTYSRTLDRLWRKTRSRVSHGSKTCYGVDGNRNFDYQWLMECRATTVRCRGRQPCENVFAGHQPLSEPETIAVANFIHSHRETIKMFLTLHSYSQLWLTPWGYTVDLPEDNQDLMRVGLKGLEALEPIHHTLYEIGSPALILYEATGSSYDWAKGKEGIKYSYTIELRDQGRYGFMLPADQIIPTGEETWAGIKAAVREMSNDVCWIRHQGCPDAVDVVVEES